jgi:MFS family permease
VLAIFVVTLAVNLQVPLYKAYADVAGYRQGLVAVTFAAYVAGLLPVLLLLGGLPERFGNRTVLLLGLVCAALAHAVILWQPTIQALLKTRVLQGASIALSLAAGTAYLVELGATPARAARASSAAVTLGLGSGALMTSVCLRIFGQSLVPASYYLVALATLACIVAVLGLEPGSADARAAVLRVPFLTRRTLPFGIAIFCSWSLTGIILATVPGELGRSGLGQWSGLLVFAAIAVGVLLQLGPELPEPRSSLKVGYAFVAAAVGLLILGVHTHSLWLLFAASVASGFSSFGFTYVGGLTGTLLASSERRARTLAGYYLLGYVGFGFPCIAVGYMTEFWGLERALCAYWLAVGSAFVLGRVVSQSARRSHASAE